LLDQYLKAIPELSILDRNYDVPKSEDMETLKQKMGEIRVYYDAKVENLTQVVAELIQYLPKSKHLKLQGQLGSASSKRLALLTEKIEDKEKRMNLSS